MQEIAEFGTALMAKKCRILLDIKKQIFFDKDYYREYCVCIYGMCVCCVCIYE